MSTLTDAPAHMCTTRRDDSLSTNRLKARQQSTRHCQTNSCSKTATSPLPIRIHLRNHQIRVIPPFAWSILLFNTSVQTPSHQALMLFASSSFLASSSFCLNSFSALTQTGAVALWGNCNKDGSKSLENCSEDSRGS